jgi:hypothetical protein
MGLRWCATAVFLLLLFITAPLYAAKASCTFDTFSVPAQYTLSSVEGIADDGTVVGQVIDNKTQLAMGFMLSSNGTFTAYSAPESQTTWMYGENASGTSAGYYLDNSSKVHGFTLVNGQFNEYNYGKGSNTWLFGVNHVGSLVGSYGGGASTKGFLLVDGQYTSIVVPGQQVTFPVAVNDNNAVVGSSASGFVNYGFLWQNGTFTSINYPKSKYGTILSGINNAGVIVGNRISADKAFGFIYENGAFKSVDYAGADYTEVGGINNNGVISGQVYLTGTNSLGFTATCK